MNSFYGDKLKSNNDKYYKIKICFLPLSKIRISMLPTLRYLFFEIGSFDNFSVGSSNIVTIMNPQNNDY